MLLKKPHHLIPALLIFWTLLFTAFSPARAELNLGLTGERMAALGGEEAARYWAAALAEKLGEEVILRIFVNDEPLAKAYAAF
jgi:hypothetical protein